MEDDPKIARLLEILFQNRGYEVKVARDGEQGWEFFVFFDPKIVLIDLMLPKLDGFELIERIRSVDQEVGIIVLTARGEVENKIRGFKKGADDYIPKPFHLDELVARVEALEKRVKKNESMKIGSVVFEPKNRTLTLPDGKQVVLSERESTLLYWLAIKAGVVVSRDELLRLVWGDSENISKNIVDVYVKYLRDKLGRYGEMIKTVRGSGYVLDA